MTVRWPWFGILLALLAGAPNDASGQAPPTMPQQQGQAIGGEAKRLGRPFPRQLAPLPVRQAPGFYVSVVSPRQSSTVFQKIGRQRTQANSGRGTGGMSSGSQGFPAQ